MDELLITLAMVGVLVLAFFVIANLEQARNKKRPKYRIRHTDKGYWIEWSDGTKEFHENKHVIDDILDRKDQQ